MQDLMRTITGALWAASLVALCGQPVFAQAPEELARRLVGEGIEAAKSRDWIVARDRFERAYKIQPLPLTLYNLAVAQEKTGLFVEADRAYRIFLRETEPGESGDFRRAAASRRAWLRDKIAYVVLVVENAAAGDQIRIGDREIAHVALGEAIPSNPGTFEVRVQRVGEVIGSKAFRLAEGQSLMVPVQVPKQKALPMVVDARPARSTRSETAAVAEASAEASPPPEEGGSIFSSPLFWSILGAAVVAGGIGGYFALRPEGEYASTLGRVEIDGR